MTLPLARPDTDGYQTCPNCIHVKCGHFAVIVEGTHPGAYRYPVTKADKCFFCDCPGFTYVQPYNDVDAELNAS